MEQRKLIDLTDSGLFNSIRNDDKVAYKVLYDRYWSRLYMYAYNVLKDKDLCEDVVQEIFVNIWIRRHEIEVTNPASYLFQAVKYSIFNHIRNSKYKRQLLEKMNESFQESDVSKEIEFLEFNSKVEDVISKLPEQRKKIFHLSRNENLSNKEIADKLGLSIQTVKNQISKTLQTLRNAFKNR
ncbi:MAG: RNA polymerase sigma-70 factor [Ignavibacteriaceae bacterium]|nr:RNA polymerase sigma-70 factor [Ignavibacteriaceae bacterium]